MKQQNNIKQQQVNIYMEDEYVHNVYNLIYKRFDKTRTYGWAAVKSFFKNIKYNALVLDAGCGNGKNMKLNDKCHVIGFDYCEKFVEMCWNKNLNVLRADIKSIPYRDNIFDATISVAVIHHIFEINERIRAIDELIRVTKSGGQIFIQVWSNEVKKNKKFIRINNNNDYYITWFINENKKLHRYYHLFEKTELIKSIPLEKVHIVNIIYEVENWIIILHKK